MKDVNKTLFRREYHTGERLKRPALGINVRFFGSPIRPGAFTFNIKLATEFDVEFYTVRVFFFILAYFEKYSEIRGSFITLSNSYRYTWFWRSEGYFLPSLRLKVAASVVLLLWWKFFQNISPAKPFVRFDKCSEFRNRIRTDQYKDWCLQTTT